MLNPSLVLGEAYTKVKSITFKDLRERVRFYQNALKNFGIKKGDFVAGN
jgi:acyl-coenzyme A synthetase/AMP-(fatty) acid ligase